MENNFRLKGKIESNKPYFSIECDVQLSVSHIDDDTKDESLFVDGVRLIGELSYLDSNPPANVFNQAQGHNGSLKITLWFDDDLTSKSSFNIVLLSNSGSTDVPKSRYRKYFWQFTNVGLPFSDKLKIFPQGYQGKKRNRLYFCKYSLKQYLIVAETLWHAKRDFSSMINAEPGIFVNIDFVEYPIDNPIIHVIG